MLTMPRTTRSRPPHDHRARALWSLGVIFLLAAPLAACGGGFLESTGDDSNAGGIQQGDQKSDRSDNPRNPDLGSADAGAFSTPGSTSGSGGTGGTAGPFGGQAGAAQSGGSGAPAGNTNVSLSGAQDFGFFRAQLNANQIPNPDGFEAAGFFAEHHTKLPPPVCGERICLQTLVGVMGNLMTGANCTMLQIGLNSPIVADKTQRPPLTLAVVVDVSGSMATENKIGFVREGLGKLIDGLRDGDKLALLTYSTTVEVRFPMQEIALKRAELRAIASSLKAEGGTNFHDGLKAGYEQVSQHLDSGRQNRVIMLSDGRPTVGITSNTSIIAMSRAFNSDGVGLTTVGLGTDFNAALMSDLSKQADGNFYFLENSAAVSEVFTEELSYFTVPVAFDLKVEMTRGTHYAFGRAFGSPFWKNTADGGTLEVPSVFLAHRESHADQTPEGGRRGGGSALLIEMMPQLMADNGSGLGSADIGSLKLTFREPGTNRIVTQELVSNYPEAPWITPERGFFAGTDIAVAQKSFVMLNLYAGIENACRTFHQSRASASEHITLLRQLLAAVRDYNEEIGDKDIEADIALVEQLLAVLLRNGVIDPTAPVRTNNPWPAD